MRHSIQEIIKKINSRLSAYDTASIAVASFFLIMLALYVVEKNDSARKGIAYQEEEVYPEEQEGRPFASRNGPTYTYSWCSGADKIKPGNKVFFRDAEEAEKSGRTLSKLCQR